MENDMKKTCLHGCHTELEAKMAPFAGYDMPIEYTGLDEEHKAVRTRAGLFDVSHMGEIYVGGTMLQHLSTMYSPTTPQPWPTGRCSTA